MEQQAESSARLSSCSSLMPAGKKLSSKIGFVHKGGQVGFSSSCDAKPPPSHLCNYEVSGREARKSELVQIGRTVPRNLAVLQTLSCFALGKPLLSKTFSSVEYIRRIVCSWAIYKLQRQLSKKSVPLSSRATAIQRLSYLGGHFPRLYTGFTGAGSSTRGFLCRLL